MGITREGVDLLSVYGFDPEPDGVEDHMSAAPRSVSVQEVSGRDDALYLDVGGVTGARRITVSGTIVGTSRADLITKRQGLIRALGSGLGDWTFPDQPTLFIRGVATEIVAPKVPDVFKRRGVPFGFTIVCADPYYHESTLTSIAVPGTGVATDVPIGNGPVRPLVTINGPATSPVLIYKDHAGVERGRLTFTGTSLSSGQSLVIDCYKLTVKNQAGADMPNTLVSPYRWFRFLAKHAVADSGPYATVTLNSGSATVAYRKAWE